MNKKLLLFLTLLSMNTALLPAAAAALLRSSSFEGQAAAAVCASKDTAATRRDITTADALLKSLPDEGIVPQILLMARGSDTWKPCKKLPGTGEALSADGNRLITRKMATYYGVNVHTGAETLLLPPEANTHYFHSTLSRSGSYVARIEMPLLGENPVIAQVYRLTESTALPIYNTPAPRIPCNLAISEDGSTFVMRTAETVEIHDIPNQQVNRIANRTANTATKIAVSHDGSRIATCVDRDIWILDRTPDGLRSSRVIPYGKHGSKDLALSADGVIVACHCTHAPDTTISLWNCTPANPLPLPDCINGAGTQLCDSLQLSHHGERVLTQNHHDRTVKVWATQTGTCLHTLPVTYSHCGNKPVFADKSLSIVTNSYRGDIAHPKCNLLQRDAGLSGYERVMEPRRLIGELRATGVSRSLLAIGKKRHIPLSISAHIAGYLPQAATRVDVVPVGAAAAASLATDCSHDAPTEPARPC